MDGLRTDRTGVIVVRLWDPGSGAGLVGRVSLTTDVASAPREEISVRDEAELRRVVHRWLEELAAQMSSGGAHGS